MNETLINQVLSLLDAHETDEGVLMQLNIFGEEGRNLLLDIAWGKVKGATPSQRGRAVYILCLFEWQPVLEHISKFLRNGEPTVRLHTIYGLRFLGGDFAIQQLLDLLEDRTCSEIEKAHALRVLGNIGDAKTAKKIEDWLDKVESLQLKMAANQAIDVLRRRRLVSTESNDTIQN